LTAAVEHHPMARRMNIYLSPRGAAAKAHHGLLTLRTARADTSGEAIYRRSRPGGPPARPPLLLTYTAEDERVIRAELKRRDLPDPPPTRGSRAMPPAAGAPAGRRDRVVAVNLVLACLALAADLGAVGVTLLEPRALDWLQGQSGQHEQVRHDYREVGFALVLLAGAGGVLSLLIGATFRTTAIARGVATLAVASSMVLMIATPGTVCCGATRGSAIGALRAINSAESTYSSACAAGGYATDLADLAKAPPGSTAAFIRPDIRSNGVTLSGYVISLTRSAASGVTDVGSPAWTCNDATGQPASSYFASASPVKPGTSGARYFATDPTGTIYFSDSGPIANPIPADTRFLQ
jgi:hypothetical protein